MRPPSYRVKCATKRFKVSRGPPETEKDPFRRPTVPERQFPTLSEWVQAGLHRVRLNGSYKRARTPLTLEVGATLIAAPGDRAPRGSPERGDLANHPFKTPYGNHFPAVPNRTQNLPSFAYRTRGR